MHVSVQENGKNQHYRASMEKLAGQALPFISPFKQGRVWCSSFSSHNRIFQMGVLKKLRDSSRASRPKLKTTGSASTNLNLSMRSFEIGLQRRMYLANPTNYQPMHGDNMHDLKRFLDTVGEDPKEVRYWMKHFQCSKDPLSPFCVVMIEEEVFKRPDKLSDLCSSLSFLQRNKMKPVIIHGKRISHGEDISYEHSQKTRRKFISDTMMLVNGLECHGTMARPLFSGNRMLLAEKPHQNRFGMLGELKGVNVDPIIWCLRSDHIPVLYSIGETEEGQLLDLDVLRTTQQISIALQPRKVLMLNAAGGITTSDHRVISQVNMPSDLDQMLPLEGSTEDVKEWLYSISILLDHLPDKSSVVITSADRVLQELFTHRGSGTMFKNTERIIQYDNLDDVDIGKLSHLFARAFNRELKPDYFKEIKGRLETLYLSEGYNAAAIVTKEDGFGVPYMDKFAVTAQNQGQGTAEMLWECVRRDYHTLCWRSRHVNNINPWYFKRSEGSWSNGKWIVFWYGLADPKLSYELVEHALSFPESFSDAPKKWLVEDHE
ncbi:PREDICTED: N-acetylglutamate synthase, mitochondrial-like [Priapulus caudatus]|uniref:N-acetylglutamate synthase, mitochondrial-like n=1 Tax=Priapulus caudatus TaxID=37621 RepID=A0ABM1E686_PRICU|nr:PREDICTED: N-acetylglutamate synthase, mitochondrial-like [Priapulus caudatus]